MQCHCLYDGQFSISATSDMYMIYYLMQVPVLLPEKLSTSRCLIEVVDSVSTDLAGDAGAVGRFSIVQHGQQQQAQLDLKGAYCCACHGASTLQLTCLIYPALVWSDLTPYFL